MSQVASIKFLAIGSIATVLLYYLISPTSENVHHALQTDAIATKMWYKEGIEDRASPPFPSTAAGSKSTTAINNNIASNNTISQQAKPRSSDCICVPASMFAVPDSVQPVAWADLSSWREQPDFTHAQYRHNGIQKRRILMQKQLLQAIPAVYIAEDCAQDCDYTLEASVNFALDMSVVTTIQQQQQQQHQGNNKFASAEYRHADSGSYWKFTSKHGKQGVFIEPHLRCWFGSCGWLRPRLVRTFMGRTGNNLMQLAAAAAAAWQYNYTLAVSTVDGGTMGFAFEFVTPKDNEPGFTVDVLGDVSANCDRDLEKPFAQVRDQYLSGSVGHGGYCECFAYHWDYLYMVKVLTELDDEIHDLKATRAHMAHIRQNTNGAEVVAFHLRHGDKANSNFFIPTSKFVTDAMQVIRSKVPAHIPLVLVIVTESYDAALRLVAPIMEAPYYIFSSPGPGRSHFEDMAFARMADHFIWSVGSFSYWISTHTREDGVRVSYQRHCFDKIFIWQNYMPPNVILLENS